jgi:hypothetical protein
MLQMLLCKSASPNLFTIENNEIEMIPRRKKNCVCCDLHSQAAFKEQENFLGSTKIFHQLFIILIRFNIVSLLNTCFRQNAFSKIIKRAFVCLCFIEYLRKR